MDTVQHLLAWFQKLAVTEYIKRHDNIFKVTVVQWAVKKGIVPEGRKWRTEQWKGGKVI